MTFLIWFLFVFFLCFFLSRDRFSLIYSKFIFRITVIILIILQRNWIRWISIVSYSITFYLIVLVFSSSSVSLWWSFVVIVELVTMFSFLFSTRMFFASLRTCRSNFLFRFASFRSWVLLQLSSLLSSFDRPYVEWLIAVSSLSIFNDCCVVAVYFFVCLLLPGAANKSTPCSLLYLFVNSLPI